MVGGSIVAFFRRAWRFLWYDDSFLSWVANVALAFVLIRYIVYPLLGLLLSTSHPIVAVVSGSMEHPGTFEQWWATQQVWYDEKNITLEQFGQFPFSNGFNKGDIMVLFGKKPNDIKIGDVLVFDSSRPSPIIHRVVKKWEQDGKFYFQTKGDNNLDSIGRGSVNELEIAEERIIGVAVFRIPLLGWIKIIAVEMLESIR